MTAVEERPGRDQARFEAFGDQMVGMLNAGCTALLVSVGHQTGLFDALVEVGAVTSRGLAERARLNERYVREWLGGMTVAGVVDFDPAGSTYTLPPEHAGWLTNEAGPNNLARTMQFIPLLAKVEEDLVQCFRQGGGLSYAHYPRFHALMDEDSRSFVDAALVNMVVPLVDELDARLHAGIDVADIGCGSGHAINVLARHYPASRFVGFDFSEEAIGRANAEARSMDLINAQFELRDAALLDQPDAFDLITALDAVHDQAYPGQVLDAVARATRPGGTFLMMDFKASSNVEENIGNPMAPALYTISTMHCMTVSLGLDGDGLGTVWGRQLATSMLQKAGFSNIQVKELEDDPFNYYYVCRK